MRVKGSSAPRSLDASALGCIFPLSATARLPSIGPVIRRSCEDRPMMGIANRQTKTSRDAPFVPMVLKDSSEWLKFSYRPEEWFFYFFCVWGLKYFRRTALRSQKHVVQPQQAQRAAGVIHHRQHGNLRLA